MRPVVTMPEEERATDIASMHETFGKDAACGSGDILANIHTDKHTLQHFATAPAGEVNISLFVVSQYNVIMIITHRSRPIIWFCQAVHVLQY